MTTKVFRNISQLVTLGEAHKKEGRNLYPGDLTIIEKGALAFDQDSILFVGKDDDLPSKYKDALSTDLQGKVLIPEIVDSHTHLVYGGNRSKEYSMRLNGADYQEIAKAGGGILETMRGTNALSREELFNLGKERVERLASYGVGTIDVKSGYGLNFEKEWEISQVINDLKKHFAPRVQIKNTYMAAHAVPKEFSSSHEFIEKVVIPLLEKLAPEGILDAVDIFHEGGYFDDRDVEVLFEKALSLDIPVKAHVDEFQDNGGAKLGVKYNALSVDHLLRTSEEGIHALANSETVATFLPGTGLFLGKPQVEARKFLDQGVRVAIGSDYNPGSCHCDNVLLIASIMAPQYKMNMAEMWAAITLNSSYALGIKNQGALVEGLAPRFSLFDVNSLDQVTYHWGRNLALPISELQFT